MKAKLTKIKLILQTILFFLALAAFTVLCVIAWNVIVVIGTAYGIPA